jgi:hypothetical protein
VDVPVDDSVVVPLHPDLCEVSESSNLLAGCAQFVMDFFDDWI